MLRNYILSSLRSLRKKIGFTLVNVFGLALGIATCIVIFLFVDYDLSFDRFQKDNVYRIALNRVYPERSVKYAFVPHSIGPQMALDFPEVEKQARLFRAFGPTTIRYQDKSYIEEHVVFADSTLFEVMHIPLKEGDPKTALSNPDALVISESIAKKLFGEEHAIGKSITIPGGDSKAITAVAYDYPKNSHFEFDYLIPLHSVPVFEQPNWLGFSAITYIKIRDGVTPGVVEQRIPALVKQYADGQMRARNGISYDEYIAAGNGYHYFLQPIKDIHLHSHLEGELKPNGNISYIYIFTIVAVFILVIACINFMNLSTARSTERSKEVGIRKVLGSGKQQLIGQFLTESVIVTIVSATAAFGIAWFSLPLFNEITGRPLSFAQLLTPEVILFCALIILIIGLLAGAYPAFFISSFQPVSVLKGRLRSSGKGVALRNVLVVLQFTISIALISATILVYRQMSFLMNKPLGFDQDNIVVIENAFALNNDPEGINRGRFETFKNELKQIPNVRSVSMTSAMPGDILPGYIVRVPGSAEKESMVTRNINFDYEMLKTMGMEVIEGRFFSEEFNDSLSMVLNQSAVAKLGLKDPVGKKIINVVDVENNVEYTVIGVIRDFHFQSLHVEMEPVALTSMESQGAFPNKLVVRISQEDIKGSMTAIEGTWNTFVKDSPFQSSFLDSNLQEFYESEKATGRIFGIFTFLAIAIACIGLLGLSAFIINQRVKEIGVRKVLGASVASIILLLSKDFTKLIGISAVIAIPLAWLWMERWMSGFAYSAGISWVIFLIAGLIALFIGLATISLQSIKAATANPVNSLKDE